MKNDVSKSLLKKSIYNSAGARCFSAAMCRSSSIRDDMEERRSDRLLRAPSQARRGADAFLECASSVWFRLGLKLKLGSGKA
jgi:hypothetical protein